MRTSMQGYEENYVDAAEEAILALMKQEKEDKSKDKSILTTTKIRNLLGMTMDIYQTVMAGQEEKLDDETCARIEYLRVRFLYEAGREESVRRLAKEACILDILKSIHRSRSAFLKFSRYMEALVAFHRYYGGADH